MLILSKEYVEEHGGNARNLALFGQENNGGVWSISKMNLLLHGIPDADVKNGDTLAEPLHTEGGELMRFDRVITNPPFSLNYTRDGIPFPERFRYGWCPEGGKKADLMFVQHMIVSHATAGRRSRPSCRTVCCSAAVPNARSARACSTTTCSMPSSDLRPTSSTAPAFPPASSFCVRRERNHRSAGARCCSSTQTPSSRRGGLRTTSFPSTSRRSCRPTTRSQRSPDTRRSSPTMSCAANDVNLNIRRYADNAPPPEPQDVRAHLVGGIPKREVADKADLFAAHGFDPMHVFVERDADYYDFSDPTASKADLQELVATDPGVAARERELMEAFDTWWEANTRYIVDLPETKALMAARATLLNSFVNTLTPVGLLDRFQVAGAIASWWGDVQFDLRALAAGGFGAVVDGWATTITTALDDKTDKANPLDHRLVAVLLPEYLDEIGASEARRAELEARIKGATSSSKDEDDDDADDEEEIISAAELAALKKDLTAAKKNAKALEQRFVATLEAARRQLSSEAARDLVLRVSRAELTDQLDAYVARRRRLVVNALENWWDKYAVAFEAIETERAAAGEELSGFLRELGYG